MSSDREKLILRPGPVVETIERLVARIFERFGDCGLYRVCAQLHAIAKVDTRRAISIGRSYMWLRALVFATIATGIAVLGWMLSLIDFTNAAADNVSSIAQGIEAAANLTVLTGAAMLSLLKLVRTSQAPPRFGRVARASLHRPRDRHASADEGPEQVYRSREYAIISAPGAQRISNDAISRLLLGNAVADLEGRRAVRAES